MTDYLQAADVLRAGGVIAYPTEGVWGLGCDPYNRDAVMRILALKQRPVEKGLILAAGTLAQVEPLLANLDAGHRAILEDSWPGPHTWLLPDIDQVIPDWIRGQYATVAVRVSAHPVVAGLSEDFGGPLVSTSANPADQAPASSQDEVEAYFPGQLDLVVPGALGGQRGPSEIRDLLSQAVIRA